MHIDVYATMHNEAKILPYWLRHYEQFATRILVWEEASTDGTREMLAAHPLVTLMPMDNSHGIDDAAWVLRIWPQYRTISRKVADWVMIVDADEFVYHPALIDRLRQHLGDDVRILKLDGYHMIASHFPTTEGQIYDEIKTGIRDEFWCHKPCVFSPLVELQFRPGRHSLKHTDTPETPTDIKLLHYRFLGEEYHKARSARNIARMSEANYKYKYHRPNKPNTDTMYGLKWYRQQVPKAAKVI